MDRQEERNQYLTELMDNLFFDPWREGEEDRKSLEWQVTYDCNLNCKYCYVNRHGDDLYKEDIRNKDDVIKNTKLLLNWIESQGLQIPRWEIFSGSLFSQEIGHNVIRLMYQKLSNTNKKKILPDTITVPTNMTFLMDKDITIKVEELIHKFHDLGIRLHLSSSVEGKYMEQNRPINHHLKTGPNMGEHLFEPQERGEEYYDKFFKFTKKYNYGFHPMIYSDDIEAWKKNFLWYQGKMSEYDIPHHKLFLLEVRNQEWSDREVQEFREFVTFIHDWVYQNIADGNKEKFFELIKDSETINMIYGLIGSSKGKGMPCSIQSDVQVRLGDLHFGPCHRTSYKGLEFGKFKENGNMITGIEAINPEMAMAVYGLDHETLQGCQTCPIRPICNKTCLGANIEDTGEIFSPNPKACQLGHAKVLGALDFYKNHNMFNMVKGHSNDRIFRAYNKLDKIANGEGA